MAYNRQWLQQQIVSYLHDSSVSAELDTWIDIAAKRISQIIQCRELEGELTRSVGDADEFISVDADVRHYLGVQWQSYSGAWINLRAVPRHLAGQYWGTGTPAVYLIQDLKIYPLPFTDANYKVQVVREAAVPPGLTDETDELTAYPFVFLNAALAEAYDWKQNLEMHARYEGKWLEEARQVKANYMSNRAGEVPAMRAI